MSNLKHPIMLLVAERKIIATSLQLHGDDITKKKERLQGINEAINILEDEIQRRKNERDEIEKIKEKEKEREEKKEKAIPYIKKL